MPNGGVSQGAKVGARVRIATSRIKKRSSYVENVDAKTDDRLSRFILVRKKFFSVTIWVFSEPLEVFVGDYWVAGICSLLKLKQDGSCSGS